MAQLKQDMRWMSDTPELVDNNSGSPVVFLKKTDGSLTTPHAVLTKRLGVAFDQFDAKMIAEDVALGVEEDRTTSSIVEGIVSTMPPERVLLDAAKVKRYLQISVAAYRNQMQMPEPPELEHRPQEEALTPP